jgi:hypothetical protein
MFSRCAVASPARMRLASIRRLKPCANIPTLVGQRPGSNTLEQSSLPPASSSNTLTSAASAKRRATTDPEDPAPQTMKS